MLANTAEVRKEQERFYHEWNKEDRFTNWFYQPHTITGLVVAAGFIIYFAFTRGETDQSEDNIKYGLIAGCFAFLVFSALQMRDALFVRPHPVVWRVVMGAGVLYLILLIFLLFQSANDARLLLKKIDPSLGVALPERSYADNCTIYTPGDYHNFRYVYEAVKDEFFLAHLLGWFGKAILLRDAYIAWVLSISFELLELSFKHMLPNFAECWWDHIILDILMCNAAGIYLGMKFLHWFSVKPYHWISNVEEYHWEFLKSWKRLVAAVTLVVVISNVELNAFFLKYVLWIPPPHPINVARLLLWWSIGLPGVREFYQYVVDPNCKRLGTMAWICVAVVGVETLIEIKFGSGMFPTPHPPAVIIAWSTGLAIFLLWAVWYYSLRSQPEPQQQTSTTRTRTTQTTTAKATSREKQN